MMLLLKPPQRPLFEVIATYSIRLVSRFTENTPSPESKEPLTLVNTTWSFSA